MLTCLVLLIWVVQTYLVLFGRCRFFFKTCCDTCLVLFWVVQIKAKVGNAAPSLMTAAVRNSCDGLTSATDIDEIEAFFRANPLPNSERGISQMLEVHVSKIRSD